MIRPILAASQGNAAKTLAEQTRQHLDNAQQAATAAETARRAVEEQQRQNTGQQQ